MTKSQVMDQVVLSTKPLVVDLHGHKPFPGQFSIEASSVRIGDSLERIGVEDRRHEVPFHSKSLWNRLKIYVVARADVLPERTFSAYSVLASKARIAGSQASKRPAR